MSLPLQTIKPDDWLTVNRNFSKIKTTIFGEGASPTFEGLTLTGLADTHVLYSKAGVLTGDATFAFNDSTKILDIDGQTITGTTAIGLDMSGGTFATAIQKWPGGTIQSTGDIVFQPTVDSTTAYQWLDQDGGTPILNIDTDEGRVGIGTNSPSNELSIVKSGSSAIIDIDSNNGSSELILKESGVDKWRIIYDFGGNKFVLRNQSSSVNPFVIEDATPSNTLYLKSDGNVGIGVNSPEELLHIKKTTGAARMLLASGDNAATIRLKGVNSSDWQIGIEQSTGDFLIRDQAGVANPFYIEKGANDNAFYIDTDGNIGIGTSSPDTLLELTHAEPTITGHVNVHSDALDSGAFILRGKREDGAGTETETGTITMSHDGSGANDQLAKMVLGVNTGAGVVDALAIGSDRLLEYTGNAIFQPHTDSTTAYQWLASGGGTPVLNIDTTNAVLGVNTDTPRTTAAIDIRGNFSLGDITTDLFNDILFNGESSPTAYREELREVNQRGRTGMYFQYNGTTNIYEIGGMTAAGVDKPALNIKRDTGIVAFPLGFRVGDHTAAVTLDVLCSPDTDAKLRLLEQSEPDTVRGGILRYDGPDNCFFIGTQNNTETPAIRIDRDSSTVTGLGIIVATTALGVNETNPETPIEITHATPTITGHVNVHSNTLDSGAFQIVGKREDGAGTETESGTMTWSHDGSGVNDQLTKWVLGVNTGAGVVDVVKIDSSANTKIGDLTGANQTVIEADGTIRFDGDATVWNDLVLPLSSARVPASNAPSWTSFIGNLNNYTYGLNDFQEFSTELEHGYKGGSTFQFHIHGAVNSSNIDDRTIKFEIEYTIADTPAESGFGDVYPATTTINGELTIPADTVDLTAFSIDIGTNATGSFVQGAIVNGRVRRIASTGTEPTGDPFLTEVGIHAKDDTIGTRTAITK